MAIDRQFLDSSPKRYLLHGKHRQADVYVIDYDGTPVVVKDYRGKSLFDPALRITRRFSGDRALSFSPAISICSPSDLGPRSALFRHRIHRRNSGVGYRERRTIRFRRPDSRKHRELAAQGGILPSRSAQTGNVMVRGKEVMLIDFAGSLAFCRGNPLRWILHPILSYIDESAVIKWKGFIAPSTLTAGDIVKLNRFEWFRMLWVFNKPRLPKKREAGRKDFPNQTGGTQ
ncbi:MAG: hypothetical protein MZV63_63340 [Marinilabiliales bacterium]|nr:hypothetical protein [Marinilabiliales bacterium]